MARFTISPTRNHIPERVSSPDSGMIRVAAMHIKEGQIVDVDLSPDKSLTHRALMFAGMAEGQSTVVQPSTSYDCMSTRAALESFGVHIDDGLVQGTRVYRIRSEGARRWVNPDHVIDAGNSGTTARLLLGIGCAVPGLKFELKGDDSLMHRPMDRVVMPLRELGANILGRDGGKFLPLSVEGRTLTGFVASSSVVSAQVKSALLYAAVLAQGESIVTVPAGTRDHTERMLRALRAPISCEDDAGGMSVFTVRGPWAPEPFQAVVPKDPSAMAFFAVLAFLHEGLTVKCRDVLCNEGRLSFLKPLERAGLTIRRIESKRGGFPGETLADFEFVRLQMTKSFDILAEEARAMIDEVPALAVAAAACSGPCRFYGLEELRVKESDRLSEISRMLRVAGVSNLVYGDQLTVEPAGRVAFQDFQFESADHRMVMAAAILATAAQRHGIVGQADAARVSFPLFFDRLGQIYQDLGLL